MPRGLNILVADPGHARVHGSLSLACAAAALGRPVRMFFQGESVRAIAKAKCWPENDAYRDIGAPTIVDLFAQTGELHIEILACETGLHLTGVAAPDLRDGVTTGGLIGFLAAGKDGELVAF